MNRIFGRAWPCFTFFIQGRKFWTLERVWLEIDLNIGPLFWGTFIKKPKNIKKKQKGGGTPNYSIIHFL